MKKISDIIGRVSREVPEQSSHMTLFGHEEYTKFKCINCNDTFLLSEAYLKSKSTRKHNNDIRPFCAVCYIKTNGKAPKKQPMNAIATIEMGYYASK